MKTSRFSETQIVAILKQADAGIKVKDLCREHGISDATYYNWKAKYGGLEARTSNASRRPRANWRNSNACMPISR